MDSAKQVRAALNERVAKLVTKTRTEEKLDLTKENYAEVLGNISASLPESDSLKKFREGLENDLATPVAMSAIQKESNGKGRKASESLADIFKMDKVISLSVIENAITLADKLSKEASTPQADAHKGDPEAAEINTLIQARQDAKKNKDFAKADEIRNTLSARGITIIDTPTGPTWKRN